VGSCPTRPWSGARRGIEPQTHGIEPQTHHQSHPSIETYARLTTALGADLALRAHPNTGPRLRDRFAAPVSELLLGDAHARWLRFLEVAVVDARGARRSPGR
jgi:hypothetical protein